MNKYLQKTLTAGVSHVAFGMFVAKPVIVVPLLSAANEVMQVNDGTSGAEALTE